MASEQELELWRSHRAMLEKHNYFLLAAAGTCIGYALTQSKGLVLSEDLTALGGALLCWALSFWMGCRQAGAAVSVVYTNMVMVKVQQGEDPDAGRHPEAIQLGVQMLREVVDKHNKKLIFATKWQHRFLLVGVVFYVGWQVMLMAGRSL